MITINIQILTNDQPQAESIYHNLDVLMQTITKLPGKVFVAADPSKDLKHCAKNRNALKMRYRQLIAQKFNEKYHLPNIN